MSKSKQRQISKRAQIPSNEGKNKATNGATNRRVKPGTKLDVPDKKGRGKKIRAGSGFQSLPKKVEKTYWRQ